LANEALQEFIDLDVEELSLVDKAANEQVFVVIKSLNREENNMADEKDNKVEEQEPSADETQADEAASKAAAGDEPQGEASDDAAEKVPAEDVAESSDEAVAKAMEKVTSLVEKIVAKSAPESDNTDDGDADGADGEEDVQKAGGERALFEKQLKKAGIKGDALTKAMADFDKSFMPKKKVKKDESGDKGDTEAEAKPSLDTSTVLDTIQKAISQAQKMTPERSDALLGVAKQLQDVVNGITGDSDAQPEKQPKAGDDVQAIAKAIGELVVAFQEQTKVTKALNDRVDQIEQVHNPSTSVDEDGETDKEEKTQKSFWAGVL